MNTRNYVVKLFIKQWGWNTQVINAKSGSEALEQALAGLRMEVETARVMTEEEAQQKQDSHSQMVQSAEEGAS